MLWATIRHSVFFLSAPLPRAYIFPGPSESLVAGKLHRIFPFYHSDIVTGLSCRHPHWGLPPAHPFRAVQIEMLFPVFILAGPGHRARRRYSKLILFLFPMASFCSNFMRVTHTHRSVQCAYTITEPRVWPKKMTFFYLQSLRMFSFVCVIFSFKCDYWNCCWICVYCSCALCAAHRRLAILQRTNKTGDINAFHNPVSRHYGKFAIFHVKSSAPPPPHSRNMGNLKKR